MHLRPPHRPPPTRRARVGRGVGLTLAAALLAGCSSPTDGADLDPSAATLLADTADRLAAALESDDACAALTEADELDRQARAAGQAGRAPDEVVTETLRVAATLAADQRCDVDDVDEEATDEGDADDGGEDEATDEAPSDTVDDRPSGGEADRSGPPPGRGQGRGNGPPPGRGGGRG